MDTRTHWETIYATKQPHEVSWTQEIPQTSLDFIRAAGLRPDSRIIDIGGGDSRLVDFLLDAGFTQITVLDISEQALNRARKRLGARAEQVEWIVSDILDFSPAHAYDFWHDRAAFHFLTTQPQISRYLETAYAAVSPQGQMTVGTFSDRGPTRCSGLEIRQYSEADLTSTLEGGFDKLRCITEAHTTPFQTQQHFLFCSFRRKAS